MRILFALFCSFCASTCAFAAERKPHIVISLANNLGYAGMATLSVTGRSSLT